MRKNLPGYLLPKLVKEQAGAAYKIPVGLQADDNDKARNHPDL
jgi:L-lysine 2,3-aminomutase